MNKEIEFKNKKRPPKVFHEYFAYGVVKALRVPVDLFFRKRYGQRAVIIETVAGVPGMVGGLFQHLKSLRTCKEDQGWIQRLLDEAENERMHLMVFTQIAPPNFGEKILIFLLQVIFFLGYFFLYLFSSKTAHRIVGYLEEEAVESYTGYLKEVEGGRIENIKAPQIAIDYWKLPQEATLKDLIIAVRQDEDHHREVNHMLADQIKGKE